jgi:hypothetical protein
MATKTASKKRKAAIVETYFQYTGSIMGAYKTVVMMAALQRLLQQNRLKKNSKPLSACCNYESPHGGSMIH